MLHLLFVKDYKKFIKTYHNEISVTPQVSILIHLFPICDKKAIRTKLKIDLKEKYLSDLQYITNVLIL